MKYTYTMQNESTSFDQLIYTIGSYHFNWHNEIELFWLIDGEIEVNVSGVTNLLKATDMMVINSNYGHATFALKADSTAMRLYIEPEFFTSQGIELNQKVFALDTTANKLNPLYDELRYALASLFLLLQEASTNQIRVNHLFYTIGDVLTNFLVADTHARGISSGQKNHTLTEITKYIDANFRKEMSLDTLATKFNYSSTYLSKLFKSELGINFYEYLTRFRLQHAVRQLTDSDEKIVEIAYDNGFSDIRAFNKMFRKHFGLTPTEYRSQLSSDITHLDKHFKQELEQQHQQSILRQLEAVKEAYEQNQLGSNPCENCASKTFEIKYKSLLKNIKELTQE